jgi:hypothetical protein
VIKGLYLRHLRWWMRQPIFSDTGLLTIGYTYPNLVMAESYNSPGSPYWAMKAFLPLALPDTHPFWQAEEAPLPARRAVHTVPGARLVLATDPRTREITAINPGQPVLDWPRNAPQKYSKCAYSARFGFTVPVSGAATSTEGGLDSVISLSDDGRFFRVREQCFDGEVRDGVAYSRWQPWPDVELRSWLVADAIGHVRIHHLRTARKLWVTEAGFAVGWTEKTSRELLPDGPTVRTPLGASVLRNLHGERRAECVDLGANSHLLTSLAAMPLLNSTHEPGEHWLACWVGASADRKDNVAIAAEHKFESTPAPARLLRGGELWWTQTTTSACGESSATRLAENNAKV